MINIIPAIDIIDSSVVRLEEGDFERQTSYSSDPVEVAKAFQRAGFKRLHIVDLDGARTGRPVHTELLADICRQTGMYVDFGGGVRKRDEVEKILNAGAKQVSLGSIAITNPERVKEWIDEFGSEVFFIGADVRNGFIATHAWTKQSDQSLNDFIRYWRDAGVRDYFCTDINRDGKLSGVAIELYRNLLAEFADIKLVASGGVSCQADIELLAEAGVEAVIIGKAFYEGRISIEDLRKLM